MRIHNSPGAARLGRLRNLRLIDWLAAIGALAALAMMAREADRRFGWSTPGEIVGFAEAIDGDSLTVGGREVRLKGVDAPELGQYCQNRVGRDYACGVEAKRWLRTRLLRGAVNCRIEGKDRFGRLLGVCSLGPELINAQIVRDGMAVGFGAFAREEDEARTRQAGIWSGRFMPPAQWRLEHPRR